MNVNKTRALHLLVSLLLTFCVDHSTIGSGEHYDLTLENQSGDVIMLDKADQESLVMGLSLHDKGKQMMQQVLLRPVLPEPAASGPF